MGLSDITPGISQMASVCFRQTGSTGGGFTGCHLCSNAVEELLKHSRQAEGSNAVQKSNTLGETMVHLAQYPVSVSGQDQSCRGSA